MNHTKLKFRILYIIQNISNFWREVLMMSLYFGKLKFDLELEKLRQKRKKYTDFIKIKIMCKNLTTYVISVTYATFTKL